MVGTNDIAGNTGPSSEGAYKDNIRAMVGPAGELRAEFTKDGVHPEAEGYRVMRPIAEASIAEAGKKKRKMRR